MGTRVRGRFPLVESSSVVDPVYRDQTPRLTPGDRKETLVSSQYQVQTLDRVGQFTSDSIPLVTSPV